MTRALLRRVKKIEKSPPSEDECRKGLREFYEDKKMPRKAKVRKYVESILAFLDKAEEVTSGRKYSDKFKNRS